MEKEKSSKWVGSEFTYEPIGKRQDLSKFVLNPDTHSNSFKTWIIALKEPLELSVKRTVSSAYYEIFKQVFLM